MLGFVAICAFAPKDARCESSCTNLCGRRRRLILVCGMIFIFYIGACPYCPCIPTTGRRIPGETKPGPLGGCALPVVCGMPIQNSAANSAQAESVSILSVRAVSDIHSSDNADFTASFEKLLNEDTLKRSIVLPRSNLGPVSRVCRILDKDSYAHWPEFESVDFENGLKSFIVENSKLLR